MMIKPYPEIKVTDAVAAFGGNKSALANYLGISPAAVSQWTTRGRKTVPTVQAYRLRDNHPDFK
jgi:DNA-binding transcriptional regulator YdaS (Cro superfamily)